ncbi:MAG: hypothetical protein ACFFFB_09975, partial [Candidatus Heimdallarchaeota archaeon]
MKNNKGLKTKLVLLGLIITIILAVLIQPLAQSLLSNSKTANLDDHVGMMQENLIVDSLRFSQSDEPVYNPDSNKYFMTIQAAIDDPLTQNGHCIFVSAGVYDENICVHKELKIIGAGADITLVQAVHPYGAVFSIPASHVTIQGFQLTGATEQDSAGIRIGYGSHE